MPSSTTTRTATILLLVLSTCKLPIQVLTRAHPRPSNGTADLCLPASLNTSQTSNSNSFFNALVTGNSLDTYTQNVFTSSQCTGCIYEMYKAG